MARTPESRPATPLAAPEQESRILSKFETLFCQRPLSENVDLGPENLLWLRLHNKALWPSGDCDQLALYFFDDDEEVCEAFVVGGIHDGQPVVLTYAELQGLVNAPYDNGPAIDVLSVDSVTPLNASVDMELPSAEQLPETETLESSEPPAEFIKKLEEIRATFDIPLVCEYYNNLSSEELQQVACLAWWIVNDIGKQWLVYGKPNGFRHPGNGGMIEHGIGGVSIENPDKGFVKNYRSTMVNFFQKHSAEMVMSEPNDNFSKKMNIWLGPPLRENREDKESQAYRLFHLSTKNPGGDATLYDKRGTAYEHSFFLRWDSPFFQWLRETEDLRPLTFAIREAAVYLDPDTDNQRIERPFVTHNWVAGGFELNGKATLTDSGNKIDGSEGFAAVHAIDYTKKVDAVNPAGITTLTLTASFPNYQEFATALATDVRLGRTPHRSDWRDDTGTVHWITPMTESYYAAAEDHFSVDLKTGKTQW